MCVLFRLLPVPGSGLVTARNTAAVCSLLFPPKAERLERMDFDGEGIGARMISVAGTGRYRHGLKKARHLILDLD